MIPIFEHNVCNEIAMQGIGAHMNGLGPLCGWKCLFLYIRLSEEGAQRGDFSAQQGSGGTIAPRPYLRFSYVKLRFGVF